MKYSIISIILMSVLCSGCGHHHKKGNKEFTSKFKPINFPEPEDLPILKNPVVSAKEEIEKAFSPPEDNNIIPGCDSEEKKTESSWFFWNG